MDNPRRPQAGWSGRGRRRQLQLRLSPSPLVSADSGRAVTNDHGETPRRGDDWWLRAGRATSMRAWAGRGRGSQHRPAVADRGWAARTGKVTVAEARARRLVASVCRPVRVCRVGPWRRAQRSRRMRCRLRLGRRQGTGVEQRAAPRAPHLLLVFLFVPAAPGERAGPCAALVLPAAEPQRRTLDAPAVPAVTPDRCGEPGRVTPGRKRAAGVSLPRPYVRLGGRSSSSGCSGSQLRKP